ncbi:hypothetical protein OV203_34040 [Nannocystis sp. ILAH1]|uniref:hypothetical protein n=1 Tax=unclassified Nannocystis TaxID=2627009 RepID=UPI002270CF0B|nr:MULTISPECIES: hypothetical protein [unclassified Nannocystis]MCY0992209.1 hypothetical protein [Nannocystis sp. ILAH1]MCY1069201.1 hypothetical protein [Nannocystis sp. RBIL2]
MTDVNSKGPAPIQVPVADSAIPEAEGGPAAPTSNAVADARDKLLAAIGAEAQLVAEKSAGDASKPLAELARAFNNVTIKNMITGTSQADVALLVVPADRGGFEGAFARETQVRLLTAIGGEAQHLAEKSAGQASTALAELAHAFTLVTSPSPAAARIALAPASGLTLMNEVAIDGSVTVTVRYL